MSAQHDEIDSALERRLGIGARRLAANTTEACDRCGAQGVYLVPIQLGTGDRGELIFCGHHGRKYEVARRAKLQSQGVAGTTNP